MVLRVAGWLASHWQIASAIIGVGTFLLVLGNRVVGLTALPGQMTAHIQQMDKLLEVERAQLCLQVTPRSEWTTKCVFQQLLR